MPSVLHQQHGGFLTADGALHGLTLLALDLIGLTQHQQQKKTADDQHTKGQKQGAQKRTYHHQKIGSAKTL